MYAPAAVHWPEKYYVPGSSCQPRGHDMVLLNFQLIFTMLQLIYAIGTPKYATGNNHSMITSHFSRAYYMFCIWLFRREHFG